MRAAPLFALSSLCAALLPASASAHSFTGPTLAVLSGWDQTDIGRGLAAREGALYGLAAGHDWRAGPLRLGIEGEIAGSTARGTLGAGEQRVGRSLYAGGRMGLPLGERVMLHAKGGYANGRFSGPVPYTGDGWRVGGGGEVALGEGLFLRAEFRYSDYGRRARGQQAAAALGWRF